MERKKEGFGIPINIWLKTSLRDWAFDLLSNKQLNSHGYFKNVYINKILNEHMKGTHDHSYQLWYLLMFQSWYLNYKNV